MNQLTGNLELKSTESKRPVGVIYDVWNSETDEADPNGDLLIMREGMARQWKEDREEIEDRIENGELVATEVGQPLKTVIDAENLERR